MKTSVVARKRENAKRVNGVTGVTGVSGVDGFNGVNGIDGVNVVNGVSKKTRRQRLQRVQPKPRLQRLQRLQGLFKSRLQRLRRLQPKLRIASGHLCFCCCVGMRPMMPGMMPMTLGQIEIHRPVWVEFSLGFRVGSSVPTTWVRAVFCIPYRSFSRTPAHFRVVSKFNVVGIGCSLSLHLPPTLSRGTWHAWQRASAACLPKMTTPESKTILSQTLKVGGKATMTRKTCISRI